MLSLGMTRFSMLSEPSAFAIANWLNSTKCSFIKVNLQETKSTHVHKRAKTEPIAIITCGVNFPMLFRAAEKSDMWPVNFASREKTWRGALRKRDDRRRRCARRLLSQPGLVRKAYHVRDVEYQSFLFPLLPQPSVPSLPPSAPTATADMCGTYAWEIYSSPNIHYEPSSPSRSTFPLWAINKIESTSSV